MPHIHVTKSTTASPDICWSLIADFGKIDHFNPNLSSSHMLTDDAEIGLGSKRQCDMTDGKSYIREEIIEWKEGEYYVVNIYEGNMPIANTTAKISLSPAINGGTLLTMDMKYDPKFGLVGKAMNAVFMQRMMTGLTQKVVDGLAEKAQLAELKSNVAA